MTAFTNQSARLEGTFHRFYAANNAALLKKVYYDVARRENIKAQPSQHGVELKFAKVSGLIGKNDEESQLM